MLEGAPVPDSGKSDDGGSKVSLSEGSPCSPSGDEPSARSCDVATSPDSFSAVVGTEAFGSAEPEAGASVAVSPPPQDAATRATAKTAASSNVCDLRFWMFSSYCEEIASRG